MPYQQAVACCNPQGPTHWLNERANANQIARILSRHEDNPSVTPEYLAMLDKLTGVRRARLFLGAWAAADGMVYEDSWDASQNIQPRVTISKRPDDLYGDCGIDHSWTRYLSIDFGYTLQHPFVCQWWAEDPEGCLWMYREIYQTGKLVEDHAALIREKSAWGRTNGDPLPRAIICDHDAEGRATLERHLGMRTLKADKRVLEGIQIVASRMRTPQGRRPLLVYLRDSLVNRDAALVDAKRPSCTAEEVESYIWKLSGSVHRPKDEVEKDNDHGQDATRYICMYRDMRVRAAKYGGHL
jgi:phage terminase large subunit